MKLTENESNFCQALAITFLIGELHKNKFLESNYYNELKFTGNNEIFKEILNGSTLGNPVTLQMFLYILLVMPREILTRDSCKDLKQMEKEINSICSNLADSKITESTYKNEERIEKIDYYCHIRNAVSHARCYYCEKNGTTYVTFVDEKKDKNKSHCKIAMSTKNVGSIIEILQVQLMNYINKNACKG